MGKKKRDESALDETIRINMQADREQLYSSEEKSRAPMGKESRRIFITLASLLTLFVLSVLLLGNVLYPSFSLAWVSQYVARRIGDIAALLTGGHAQSDILVFICQFITPVIAGAALAVSGACFQAIFHNPMASPTLLGVQAGGTLGATVFALFFYKPMISTLFSFSYADYAYEYNLMSVWQKYGQYFCVLGGALVVAIMVMLMSKISGRGRISTVTLMVGGTIFSTSISSIVNMVQYYETVAGGNAMVISQLQSMQAGAYQNILQPELLVCFALSALLPMIPVFILRSRLNIISFGEQEARLMGVSIGKERTLFLLLATSMTAAVVAFCGNISFVGLVAPHFARQIVGNDYRHVIPESALLGGLFMLAAYDISYMFNSYLNVGVVVGLVGGVIFTVFMTRYRRKGNADWA
jgi:iron complex transport system permease protein